MRILHQLGHNYKWNFDCIREDNAGDGAIVSPVNIDYSKAASLSSDIRARSFLDPQLYLPHDAKGKIDTYPYFPEVFEPGWKSQDYAEIGARSAESCLRVQETLQFGYRVIPFRYSKDITPSYYKSCQDALVEPFINAWTKSTKKPLLISIIVKRIQLIDTQQNAELLNWITSFTELSGVYLIFESDHQSKQIKDSEYLFRCMRLIGDLTGSGLEVHVGYTNTEALLFAAVGAASITMGSYENLRRFQISRFVDSEPKGMRGPNPRLYVKGLMQWIEQGYLGALSRLYKRWPELQENTRYEVAMFTPTFRWHFSKPELYKHYFSVFSDQVSFISDSKDPLKTLQTSIESALQHFEDIRSVGVILDGESDGSHLNHWMTAINMYRLL